MRQPRPFVQLTVQSHTLAIVIKFVILATRVAAAARCSHAIMHHVDLVIAGAVTFAIAAVIRIADISAIAGYGFFVFDVLNQKQLMSSIYQICHLSLHH